MKPQVLKKASTLLSKTFHIEDFLDNAIAVSFGPNDSPFALVILEDEESQELCYSVAVDAPDPHSVADIALRLIHMAKTVMSEPFYINKDGEILWGEEAYRDYMSGRPEDSGNQAFLDLESPSKLVN